MFYLIRKETDPYFNLAAEEYLLKHGPGEMFMLWQNDPCVVIGKHQNAFAEVNVPLAVDHNIPVIRRISGGGAVYHDQGNVNFTFIADAEKGKQVDFLRFLKPLAEILKLSGLNVEIGRRNDLLTDGKKFSGNAEHVFKNRVIHHGTLLFDTNLDMLNTILEAPVNKFQGKALQSVRSVVTNLKPLLPEINTIDEFIDKLLAGYLNNYPDSIEYQLSVIDRQNIEKLADERYRTDSWNFGYSPDFELKIDFKNQNINIKVTRGLISKIELSKTINKSYDDFFYKLTGLEFNYQIINQYITSNSSLFSLTETEIKQLIQSIFI